MITKNLWLHVKLDTGMGRIGMKDIDEYKEVVDLINKRDHLVLKEFSHILRVQMNLEIL